MKAEMMRNRIRPGRHRGSRNLFLFVLFMALFFAGGPTFARAEQSLDPIATIQNLIRGKDYGKAVEEADRQLRQKPNDHKMWTLKAIALSLDRKNPEAVSSFEKALSIDPSYTPALKGETQLLYADGDNRAIPLLKRILTEDPADATAHEMLAMLDKKNNNCPEAVEHFIAAGSGIEKHGASLEAQGYCLVQLARYKEAIPVFEQLVALLPAQVYPKYDLATVLIAAKEYEAAQKALEPLLEEKTQDPDLLNLAAEIQEALGHTPQAVALLRQAIVLSPSNPDYYVSFAALCLDHDSFRTGIEMMDVGLSHVPESASIYLSRGLLHAQLAEYDAAEADFNKAGELDSAQSLSAYALDLSVMQKNNPDQALAQVKAQLKEHPDSPLLNFLLAKLLMTKTPAAGSPQFQQALEAANQAVALKPDLVEAHDLLADIYMNSGQYDLAIKHSRIALDYAPADESATYHLLISLRHTGQKEELPALVKRLAQLHQDARKKEIERKGYRLELVQNPPSN